MGETKNKRCSKRLSAAKNTKGIEENKDNHRSSKEQLELNTDEFSTKEIGEIKKALNLLKKEIFKEIDASIKKGSSKDSSEYKGDNYDIASDEIDRELSYMLGDRERKKIREIDNVLMKIEEGTYGVCDECGELISKKRLKILPYSNLCVHCQSRAETEEKARTTNDYMDHLKHLSLTDEDDIFKDPDE